MVRAVVKKTPIKTSIKRVDNTKITPEMEIRLKCLELGIALCTALLDNSTIGEKTNDIMEIASLFEAYLIYGDH